MAAPGTLARAEHASAGSRRQAVRRSWDVLISLTISDLKVRYGRGGWRLVKWIADPFALVGVYLVLVTLVLDRPGEAPGLSLACAVIPFQLFTTTIVNALSAVAARRSILLNMGFNRTLLPLSGALTETVAFGASLLLLALMMAVYGGGAYAVDPVAARGDREHAAAGDRRGVSGGAARHLDAGDRQLRHELRASAVLHRPGIGPAVADIGHGARPAAAQPDDRAVRVVPGRAAVRRTRRAPSSCSTRLRSAWSCWSCSCRCSAPSSVSSRRSWSSDAGRLDSAPRRGRPVPVRPPPARGHPRPRSAEAQGSADVGRARAWGSRSAPARAWR